MKQAALVQPNEISEGLPQNTPQGRVPAQRVPEESTKEPLESPGSPLESPGSGNKQTKEEEEALWEKVDPKLKQKVNGYVTVLMNELHSKETRDDVLEILKSSDDPYLTIPQAAIIINDTALKKVQKSGARVDNNTQLIAAQYLVQDLMTIGNSFGIFETTKEDFAPLLQDSLQMYIERGLKDGSIDPIELQSTAERFMTKNQRIGGHYFAQQVGIPYAPQNSQVMSQIEARAKREAQAALTAPTIPEEAPAAPEETPAAPAPTSMFTVGGYAQ